MLSGDDGAKPERLTEAYVRVSDDLAYAQTYYEGSPTAAYLNDFTAGVHARLYRNRVEERGRFLRFWTHEVPLAAWQARHKLALSAAVFLGSMLLGLFSSVQDDTFIRLILGDGYVNMTKANIEGGDPLAVYKGVQQFDMAFGIAFNNVMVSFITFIGMLNVGGVWLPGFSLGTFQMLFRNGVMVGAFAHLFAAEGLALEWFRVVFIHGALELSAIVVAGGAGFAMGQALLFPGTLPRLVSFRRGAKRGLKLIIGLIPVFLAAAALEGSVTRYTDMPLVISALMIGGSFAFVGFYFVYWPRVVAHRQSPSAAGYQDRDTPRASSPATQQASSFPGGM